MNIASNPLLAAFGFSGTELLLVLLIILVLFGGAKLPSLARGLGQSIKEFKKAARDDEPEKTADNKTAPTPEDKSKGSS